MKICDWFQKLAKEKKIFLVLFGVILLIGIGFRTYRFHDFLRFNPDQSRDAGIVSDVISGNATLPLLGPKAGGTNFRLGPAFYYFEYISARIFGDYPDKMAYPDLLFSLLAIPLLYLLLRKYFDRWYALAVMAILSTSFYAIKYAHFAWNPNSAPFWTILFLLALTSLSSRNVRHTLWWITLLGISLGIGVQLHTFLLVLLPIITFIAGVYLIRQKLISVKHSIIILFIAFCLNIPQVINEWQTNWKNTEALFQGASIKNKRNTNLAQNILLTTQCFAKGNMVIISFVNASDDCSLFTSKRTADYLSGILSIVFTLGGLVLGIIFMRKEQDPAKKFFLRLLYGYFFLSFLVMLPVVNELSMRYFLILVFMPYILLGFWIRFLKQYSKILCYSLLAFSVVILFLVNGLAIRDNFSIWAGYTTKPGGSEDIITLKEIELIAGYLVTHSGDAKVILLEGKKPVLFKTEKSIAYLIKKFGKELKIADTKTTGTIFCLEKTPKSTKSDVSGMQEYETFGRFSVYTLER